jgi:Na+/H+-dicarboxylate symporter
MMQWIRELHWQIVIASILGISVGLLLNGVEQTWWLQLIDFVG